MKDAEGQRRVSALRQIKASAGSGKTHTLTASFLEKLKSCTPGYLSSPACRLGASSFAASSLSELLAITFTNAAASEMRDRIILRLKKSALGLEKEIEPQLAKKWLAYILADLKSLNIRTIDSLFQLIVKSSALELGLDPDFEPEFSFEELFQPVFDRYLENAANDPTLRQQLHNAFAGALEYGQLKGFTNNSRLMKDLKTVLAGVLHEDFNELANTDEIGLKLQEYKNNVISRATELLSQLNADGLPIHKTASGLFDKCASGEFETISSAFASKSSVREVINGKKKDMCTDENERAYQEFAEAVKDYNSAAYLFNLAFGYLPLVNLARELARNFSEVDSRKVVGNLMPLLAARVVNSENGVPDALCHLGTRLTHFLVDEFQDTSREQWDVLRSFAQEGLSRGGSLTWVGDVKQSIYSWRGGDSKLFDAVKNDPDLTAIVPDGVSDILGTNWRSKKNIVEHNNAIFSQLGDSQFLQMALAKIGLGEMPAAQIQELIANIGQIYKEQEVRQACAANDEEFAGIVVAKMIPAASSGKFNELVREDICALIKEKLRPRRPWSDILILCRSNESCRETAEALIKEEIPVITENSLLLADRPLIIQALAFLEFMANPADDLAFWKIITGSAFLDHPAAGDLNKAELVNWLAGLAIRHNALFREFAKNYPQLWQAVFAQFLADGNLLAPYDLIREWFYSLNLEKRYPEEKVFLRRFLEVVHAAESRGMLSLSDFLEYWKNQGQEEKAPLPQGMDAVRIMTIHKAKGLQAPVVILPSINFRVSPNTSLSAINVGGVKIPVKIRNKDAGKAYFEELTHNILETLNLLYVAFTRPEDELYFYLPEEEKSNNKTILPLMQELLLKNGSTDYCIGTLPKENSGKKEANSEDSEIVASENAELASVPDRQTWRPMGWLPRLKVFRAHPASARLTPNERGTFIHFCLERLVFIGDSEKDALNAFNYGLKHSGISIPDDPVLRKQLVEMLAWFARIRQVPDWIKNGWPEHTLVDENGKTLRTDLIVPHEDGVLIIDYKTGAESLGHVHQLQNYIACLEKTGQFAGQISGLLIYLDLKSFRQVTRDDFGGLTKECPI